MKNKPQKGTFGYIDAQKKRTLIRTILFFGLSLAIFFLGLITTGSKQNYLSIVAVLGCLPASKSAVNTIMFYRYHGCSPEDRKKIRAHEEGLTPLYDLVFTSYEKNFEIHHMSLEGTTLIGYSANEKCDASACEKHLRTILSQNGLKLNVKIFKDLSKYTGRMDQIADRSPEEAEELPVTGEKDSERTQEVLSVLLAICL